MTPGLTVRPCPAYAYACAGCGRDMVVLVGDAPADDRCARCRMLPGWHGRPDVIALLHFDAALLDFDAALLAATPDTEVGHA